ncbi:IclR family transcriptional regulator C-terminal domain-containing protein [Rhodococcus sp. MEB032]|uniref:IclR family transcriptional regulator domain-containing protein n=1 Tax=Rhodococcus sp. MEB032 TaxID=3040322 RepID=UPI00330786FF
MHPQLAAREISRNTGLPVNSTNRLLKLMSELVDSQSSQPIRIGDKAFQTGYHARNRVSRHTAAWPHLVTLHHHTRLGTHLGALDGEDLVMIARIPDSRKESDIWPPPGKRPPAHRTSMGKAILAASPSLRRRLLSPGHSSHCNQSTDSLNRLHSELSFIRRSGIALGRNEPQSGHDSIAVAIGPSNIPIGALPDWSLCIDGRQPPD